MVGLTVVWLLAGGSTIGASAPSPSNHVTYILPLWQSFQSASDAVFADAVARLRAEIGEGPYVRVGFCLYVAINMTDWTVDITDSGAVRAALASTIVTIDLAIARARAHNIPMCVNLVTAIRERVDPVQTASQLADRRSMQWYSDNGLSDGWWSHTRYARRARAIQEAYMRELGRVLANRMSMFPDTLVAVSGDGEVELSYERTPVVDPSSTPETAFLADYSPFTVKEFADWLRRAGLYAPGQSFSGQAYEFAGRYAGDVSPDVDTNGDGHTLNGDFATSFTTWCLRYYDWSLDDSVGNDPNAIPATVYNQPGWDPLPSAGPTHFDPPRVRQPGDPWWEHWMLFRQTMIWRHNQEVAQWMTTSPDPASGMTVPPERWYSYQIPADYLFGHTPSNPDYRLETSASPSWTADVAPYGSAGVTSFNINLGNGSFARTFANLAPVLAARNPRFGILEWNPSVPVSTTIDVYRDEMAAVEMYRPSLLVPYAWGNPFAQVENTLFETALGELVDRIKDGIPPAPHMRIIAPASGATVTQPFSVSGYAVDLGGSGTGVDAVQVWATPTTGGNPVFLGPASYGGLCLDASAIFGPPHKQSGFDLSATGLAPGLTYNITAYAHSTISGTFNNSVSATVTVADGSPPPPSTARDDVVVDFGPGGSTPGLSVLYNSGPDAPTAGAFTPFHPFSPTALATGDLDGNGRADLIIDFPGFGVWLWRNNAVWVQLHTSNVAGIAAGDLDGDSRDDVIVDFPGLGLWVWLNDASWVRLHPTNPSRFVVGDLDGNGKTEVIIDFPAFGIWVWLNNGSWFQLHPLNGAALATGDLDGGGRTDVVINFPGFGIWVWSNNASWSPLHPATPSRFVTADLDGSGRAEVIIDFPGFGHWVWLNNGSWFQLHPFNGEEISPADVDGNGADDLLIDFGALGLWGWVNNASFVPLHTENPEQLTAGDLDGM